ncbi:MFS transporter [Rhodococcus sp. C1]|uniref:MFS transporter n=1 Tax=Rhodococcus sp. C1 TaxID=644410 RepID=UPI001E4812C9|nr:MFS transporter [Rhodococcus sp. C1]UEL31852.1 MFS transporter [Rhodococcus sp. C1]
MTGAAQRAGFWGVLALRDFRLLWTGDAVSGIGNGVTTVVLPLIALRELDASSFQIGVLASAVWLPWLIVGLPAGAWIDRLPRRPIMMIANAACALFFASLAIAGFLEAMTYGHLLLVALLTGTATVFFQAAYHSYLPTVLAEADLVEGNSKIQGAEAATRVIGPSVGGLVVATVGLAAGLVVDAFTFAFCFVCIWLIRVQETVHRGQNQREPLRRQIALGLRFVAGDPYLRSIVVYGTLLNFGLTGYSTIQIVFLEKTVGVGEFGLGLLLAIAWVGGIVGSMIARPLGRRFGTARSVLTCQLVTGPFILLAPLTTYGAGLFWFCIGGMVMVAGVVSCNVVLGSFRQSYCPPDRLGRVVATSMYLLHSSIPLGALTAGYLGDAVGPRGTMWIMACLIAPCGLVLLFSPLRGIRDLPSRPAVPLR